MDGRTAVAMKSCALARELGSQWKKPSFGKARRDGPFFATVGTLLRLALSKRTREKSTEKNNVCIWLVEFQHQLPPCTLCKVRVAKLAFAGRVSGREKLLLKAINLWEYFSLAY